MNRFGVRRIALTALLLIAAGLLGSLFMRTTGQLCCCGAWWSASAPA